MNAKQIVALVTKEAQPIAESAGCVIWDVKFLREAGEWVLRVLVDTVPPGHANIEMCEKVNRALDTRLDELDPIDQSYCLEVSTPGINRELYRPSDFDLFTGTKVDIRLYKPDEKGRKSYTAVLTGQTEEAITLELDGQPVTLPLADMASCRVHFDF